MLSHTRKDSLLLGKFQIDFKEAGITRSSLMSGQNFSCHQLLLNQVVQIHHLGGGGEGAQHMFS